MFLSKLLKDKHHIFIVTILLAVSYLQPAGTQLKICFGDDGHFDVSAEADWNRHHIHHRADMGSDPDDHHRGCLDLILVSNDMISCRANSRLSISNLTVSRINDIPVLVAPDTLTIKSGTITCYSGFLSERCDYIPSFLSSIILLI